MIWLECHCWKFMTDWETSIMTSTKVIRQSKGDRHCLYWLKILVNWGMQRPERRTPKKFPGSFYFLLKSRVASLNVDVTGKYGVLANRVRIVESPPRVWAAALVKRRKDCQWNLKSASHLAFFLAVQDNSIPDIVCLSLGQSQLTIRAYGASKSDPRHK